MAHAQKPTPVEHSNATALFDPDHDLVRTVQQLSAFLETAQIGLHRVGPDGKIVWANSAEMAMLGYEAHEYIGQDIRKFHVDRPAIDQILAALSRGEKLYEYEARLRCKDGSIKHVLIDTSVYSEGGRFLHTQCFTRDITRQKEAQEQLREAQRATDQTLERVTDGFISVDRDWRITFINRYAAQIFGRMRPTEDLLGKDLWQSFPGLSETIVATEYRRAMDEQIVAKFEVFYEPLRGWFHVSAYPSPDGLSAYFTEITERKLLEHHLRESEERFRTLADNIAQFTWMADGSGAIFWYNKRWLDYTGLELEEMKGWGWQKVHHPGHVARVVEKIQHAFATGEPWEDTFPLRGRDGTYRWFLSRALPIRNDEGTIVRWFGTNTDITEQRETEAALARARDRAEESERFFRAFITASSDIVYRMNADWTEMHRLEGKHFIPSTPDPSRTWLTKYIHPDDQRRVLAAIDEAIREKKTFELEHRVIQVDGTLGWTFSRAIPLLDSDGEITEWFGAAHDITRRKRAEAALAEAHDELKKHARKLGETVEERTAHLRATIAELESVSYSLSHDMRAPLRTIQSFSEIVLANSGDKLGSLERDLLAKSINSAARLDRLIQDVLVYSRVGRESMVLTSLELEPLILQIVHERPELQPPLADVAIERPLGRVLGHESYLTQCITNLLDNAVKFVAPGTRPRIRITSEVTDGTVRLWIEDNGIGIPPGAHERVFGLLQRAHPQEKYAGTGIGLAIVRKAAERMRGTVGVEPGTERGSRFWLRLPKGD